MAKVLVFQLPSPPFWDVSREYAGGFGTADPSSRREFGHGGSTVPNVSLVYSASILDYNGHQVSFVDAQLERLNLSQAIERIRDVDPDVLISVISLPSMKQDLNLLSQAKQELPQLTIVAVGTVCKVLSFEVLRCEAIDYVVVGEAEAVIAGLVDCLAAGKDASSITGVVSRKSKKVDLYEEQPWVRDLDSLPLPAYHLLSVRKYREPLFGQKTPYFPVWRSRGCPYKCSFYCPYPVGFGKRVRFHSEERVIEEIDHLVNRFGVEAIVFRDQVFNYDFERAERLCDMIINKSWHITWVCEARLGEISPILVKKMKKAGCRRIHFGLETGDSRLLESLAKPSLKLSCVEEVVRTVKEAGIKVQLNVMVGLPGENHNTLRNTRHFLKRIRPDYTYFCWVTPYPGTRLFEEAKQKGLLQTKDWEGYTGYNPIMRTEDLSIPELKKAVVEANPYHWRELPARIVGLTRTGRLLEAIARKVRVK